MKTIFVGCDGEQTMTINPMAVESETNDPTYKERKVKEGKQHTGNTDTQTRGGRER